MCVLLVYKVYDSTYIPLYVPKSKHHFNLILMHKMCLHFGTERYSFFFLVPDIAQNLPDLNRHGYVSVINDVEHVPRASLHHYGHAGEGRVHGHDLNYIVVVRQASWHNKTRGTRGARGSIARTETGRNA